MGRFIAKLAVLESAHAAGQSELVQKDAMLGKSLEFSQKYVVTFVKFLGKSLDLVEKSNMPPFTSFLSKFSEVMEAAQRWQMKSVEWIFSEKSDKTVRADLEKFRDARITLLKGPAKELKSLTTHKTECDALKPVIQQASSILAKLNQSCNDASILATVLMFAHTAMVSDTLSKDEVKELDSATKADFGHGQEVLPDKLVKVLAEKPAPRSDKQKKGRRSDRTKDKAKEEKTEKDKAGKDKKRRKDNGDKDAKEPATKDSKRKQADGTKKSRTK